MDSKIVDGTALAIGIQFSVALPGNRALAFSTACPQDIENAELHALLKRISDAAESLDAGYRLSSVRKEEEDTVNALLTTRQQIVNYEEHAAQEFARTGRQGPLKLTASQEAALKGFKTTEEGHLARLKKYREQIAELEQLIKAA